MKAGVVIPCYNEEAGIRETVAGALRYVPEAIVVDDGSLDETGRQARRGGAFVLSHQRNRGKGEALRTGFEYVTRNKDWDAIIVIDGDGQHDVTEIPKFIKAAECSSLVLGNRMENAGDMPRLRWLTNKFTSWLISRLVHQDIPDSQCGFRLLKREVFADIAFSSSRYDAESEILLRAARKGYNITSVPVKSIYRGELSYINPFLDTVKFFKLINNWRKER